MDHRGTHKCSVYCKYLLMMTESISIFSPIWNGLPSASVERNYVLPRGYSSSNTGFGSSWIKEQLHDKERYLDKWCFNGPSVSLSLDESYCQSITIYCLPSSVTGILVSYRQSQYEPHEHVHIMLEVRKVESVAMHLELADGETITNVLSDEEAVVTGGLWQTNKCPPLLVRTLLCGNIHETDGNEITTSSNRTLFCSPDTSGKRFHDYRIHDERLDVQTKCMRLFTDGIANPDGSLRNLGVIYRYETPNDSASRSSDLAHSIYQVQLPVIGHALSEGIPSWTTTTQLNRIKNIKMWRRGSKVLGLKILRAVGEKSVSVYQKLSSRSSK